MKLIVKSFTTHKRGSVDAEIEDCIFYDINNKRFALSDGVSCSYMPRVLADILTRKYVVGDYVHTGRLGDIETEFSIRCEEIAKSLDDFHYDMMMLSEEEFHFGAATLVGVSITDTTVSWDVIGDSCLFLLFDHTIPKCICSNPVTYDSDGRINVIFDNKPSKILSDGSIIGEIIKDEVPLSTGWIVLMSDAIAKWFVDSNVDSALLDRIFSLESNEEFEELVEFEYQAARLKSDDESVVLIKVCNDDKSDSVSTESNKEPLWSIKYNTQLLLPYYPQTVAITEDTADKSEGSGDAEMICCANHLDHEDIKTCSNMDNVIQPSKKGSPFNNKELVEILKLFINKLLNK